MGKGGGRDGDRAPGVAALEGVEEEEKGSGRERCGLDRLGARVRRVRWAGWAG